MPTPGIPAHTPRPRSPRRAHRRADTTTRAPALKLGALGERVPASVWLCVPAPGAPDPGLPIWATRTIEAFSAVGDRVIVRSLGVHSSLPGEVAALIGAATALRRAPLALLPTPASAARTRALLPATTAPTSPTRPAGEEGATDVTAATSTPTVVAAARVGTPAMATTRLATPAGGAAATPAAPLATAKESARRAAVVGVGRRRPARDTDAGLVVVLAGPLAPGVRGARRPIPGRALAGWSRALRPGGILAVLAPPEIGRRRWGPPPAGVLATAQDIGLTYTAHIVLVHTAVADGRLQRPASPRRPHVPFWPVHTDLFALRAADVDPFAQTSERAHPTPNPAAVPVPGGYAAQPGELGTSSEWGVSA